MPFKGQLTRIIKQTSCSDTTTEQTLNYEMWLKALQGFGNIKTVHLCVVLRPQYNETDGNLFVVVKNIIYKIFSSVFISFHLNYFLKRRKKKAIDFSK